MDYVLEEAKLDYVLWMPHKESVNVAASHRKWIKPIMKPLWSHIIISELCLYHV